MAEPTSKILTRSKVKLTDDTLTLPKTAKRRESPRPGTSMSKSDAEIRVGDGFQVGAAIDSSFVGESVDDGYIPDRDVCVWDGGSGMEDETLVKYIKYATTTSLRIPVDKALYILYLCAHEVDRAKKQLAAYINLEDEWTDDDDRVFWHGFFAYGKNFSKIKQLLPHKRMGSIISHYYSTKKKQRYKSAINDDFGKNSFVISDDDDKVDGPQKQSNILAVCTNCGNRVRKTYFANMQEVCMTCKLYFVISNENHPSKVEKTSENDLRKRAVCPPEMEEIASQFVSMGQEVELPANGSDEDITCIETQRTVCEDLNAQAQIEVMDVRAQAHVCDAQNNRMQTAVSCDLDRAMTLLSSWTTEKPSSARQRHAYSWTEREKAAAFSCLVRNDNDYEAVAEILGNKTTEMVKAFAIEHAGAIARAIAKEEAAEDVVVDVDAEIEAARKPVVLDVIDLDD